MRLLLLLYCLLALACGRRDFAGLAYPGAADTARVPAAGRVGKIKAGTVIIQNGTGNVASPADNRKAGQRGGAAATAPGAAASATAGGAGPPWWALVLLSMASVAAWEWLTGRFVPAAWLPWRARPG